MKRISCISRVPSLSSPKPILRTTATCPYPSVGRATNTMPSSLGRMASSSSSLSSSCSNARRSMASRISGLAVGLMTTIAVTGGMVATAAASSDNKKVVEEDNEEDEVTQARLARTMAAASETGPKLTPAQAKQLVTERLLQYAASAEAGDPDSQVSIDILHQDSHIIPYPHQHCVVATLSSIDWVKHLPCGVVEQKLLNGLHLLLIKVRLPSPAP
jgi:hypothetical protein